MDILLALESRPDFLSRAANFLSNLDPMTFLEAGVLAVTGSFPTRFLAGGANLHLHTLETDLHGGRSGELFSLVRTVGARAVVGLDLG
jgi:hypothetical protein